MTQQEGADNGKGTQVNNQGTGAGQGGNDPNKNGTGAGTTFDVSKVGDEDFQKVFDDPRLWKHPRFKSLSERAKKADDIEAQQAEAEKKRLAEQGKFKELAEKEAEKRLTAEQKYQKAMIDNSIIVEATKLGAVDIEAVKALIDRNGIKLNDDGTVVGVAEAVKTLLDSKQYLKGTANNNLTIGTGTAPNGQSATGTRFTLSQIQDPVFYRANADAIDKAVKLGLVIDDTQKK